MSQNLGAVDWSTIPAPTDDGAADHLNGISLPPLTLKSTSGAAYIATICGCGMGSFM